MRINDRRRGTLQLHLLMDALLTLMIAAHLRSEGQMLCEGTGCRRSSARSQSQKLGVAKDPSLRIESCY